VRNWIDAGSSGRAYRPAPSYIRRADFDALIEVSMIGDPQPAAPSIWEGKDPMPQVPGC
jgi:hypothetical protein